jgi:hypothetical protein
MVVDESLGLSAMPRSVLIVVDERRKEVIVQNNSGIYGVSGPMQ